MKIIINKTKYIEQLRSEIKILKEKLKDLKTDYGFLMHKCNELEEENFHLFNVHSKLVDFRDALRNLNLVL